jgi:hypothetical protein
MNTNIYVNFSINLKGYGQWDLIAKCFAYELEKEFVITKRIYAIEKDEIEDFKYDYDPTPKELGEFYIKNIWKEFEEDLQNELAEWGEIELAKNFEYLL